MQVSFREMGFGAVSGSGHAGRPPAINLAWAGAYADPGPRTSFKLERLLTAKAASFPSRITIGR
jgi:hypothetical protein